MNAIEIYEKETGNKQPSNQIAYHEWHIKYVNWLEQQVVKFFAIPVVMPRFEIDFTFTDRTDASIHKETIQAETGEEALNELYRKHNYKIEWRTIKKLNGA